MPKISGACQNLSRLLKSKNILTYHDIDLCFELYYWNKSNIFSYQRLKIGSFPNDIHDSSSLWYISHKTKIKLHIYKLRQKFFVDLKYFFLFVKFIYSEKVTKFCEISTLNLSYVMIFKNILMMTTFSNFGWKEHRQMIL